MDAERLQRLFDGYIKQQLSENERGELMELLAASGMADEKAALAGKAFDELPQLYAMTDEQAARIYAQIRPVKIKKLFNWKRLAVAASILAIITLGGYFLLFNNKQKDQPEITIANDVEAPKNSKAMITLADGRKVAIDQLTMVNDGNIKVTKSDDGQIIYQGGEEELKYNFLDNPRGSSVATLTLIDGTKVWLNTASSIRFFASNAGKERKVEVTGEAYFEVAKDATRPFIVSKGETAIRVLGTHFNVNAYDDEASLKVTLLEGSVRVMHRNESNILRPGQQANITNAITTSNEAVIDEVMAWKNGYFNFKNTDIAVVLKQLQRWYDVEIVIEGKLSPLPIYGEMQRDLTLAQVLNILKKLGVKYRIEDRKLIVSG